MTRAMTIRMVFAMVLGAGVVAIAYFLGYSDGFDSGRTRF